MRPTVDYILTVLQVLTSFGSLCVMAYALHRFLTKPHESIEKEVNDLKKWRETVEKRLSKGNERFSEQGEANRVVQNALLALVDKEIRDCTLQGRDTPVELVNAKSELLNYLTKR